MMSASVGLAITSRVLAEPSGTSKGLAGLSLPASDAAE
jgi:hypothetical protein